MSKRPTRNENKICDAFLYNHETNTETKVGRWIKGWDVAHAVAENKWRALPAKEKPLTDFYSKESETEKPRVARRRKAGSRLGGRRTSRR